MSCVNLQINHRVNMLKQNELDLKLDLKSHERKLSQKTYTL